jgi:small conductance mechanosensitive channel
VSIPILLAATPEEIEQACGTEAGLACREVLDLTGSEFLADAAEWLVTHGLPIIVTLILALVVTLVAKRAIGRSLRRVADARLKQRLLNRVDIALDEDDQGLAERSGQRTQALSTVLGSAASVVVWLIAGFLVLTELGVNVAPLLAGAGVAGIALGFGAQSVVRDFLSGTFILIEDQFAVGDVVDLGQGEAGIVEDLSLRRTRLRSVDGTVWHVPNGEIIRVGNMSQHWARALLDIEVAYSTDLERAREVIKQVADRVAERDEDVIDEPEVWGVETLGASSIALRLVVKTKPSEQWRIMRQLREELKNAFDAEGIEIPFPQQTVWMRPDDPASRAATPPVATRRPAGRAGSAEEGEASRAPGGEFEERSGESPG